ncbi:MAG TPA: hypothetical protein PKH07_12955, partial [bacterium]|nr:hypothetical protein [bacterium]
RVESGATTVLPFGSPYRVSPVWSFSGNDRSVVHFDWKIVGSAGEVCNSLVVNSSFPKAPEIVIREKSGKKVASGKFEYG